MTNKLLVLILWGVLIVILVNYWPTGDNDPALKADTLWEASVTKHPPVVLTPRQLTRRPRQYLAYLPYLDRLSGRDLALGVRESLGSLPGRYRVAQILSASSVLVDRLEGEYNLPGQRLRIDGLGTDGVVDDQMFSVPATMIFHSLGRWQHETVLGATATVYRVEALDMEMISWARMYAKRQRDEQIRKAKARFSNAKTVAAAFRSSHQDVVEFIRTRNRIRMAEVNQSSPGMDDLLADERKKLAALPRISDTEIEQYQSGIQEFNAAVLTARKSLEK